METRTSGSGGGPQKRTGPQGRNRAAGLPHVIKVRDGGMVDNKAAHLVIGVDTDGYKHVLGIWIAAAEGARFWGGVLAELRNRGLKDTLIVCCDGLGGLPEAIEATWPKAIVQTCVIHLIRASMRYVSWDERKKIIAALRPIYTAVNEAAAKTALDQLRAGYAKKAPGVIAAWERAWPQFIPFLEFDAAIRKVIYTTDENVNRGAGPPEGRVWLQSCRPAAAA